MRCFAINSCKESIQIREQASQTIGLLGRKTSRAILTRTLNSGDLPSFAFPRPGLFFRRAAVVARRAFPALVAFAESLGTLAAFATFVATVRPPISVSVAVRTSRWLPEFCKANWKTLVKKKKTTFAEFTSRSSRPWFHSSLVNTMKSLVSNNDSYRITEYQSRWRTDRRYRAADLSPTQKEVKQKKCKSIFNIF